MKRSFWSKPITWGGYAKLCVVTTIIGAIAAGIEYICLFTEIPGKIVDWFKKKFRHETDYKEME